jgi:hypothetical protein
MVFNATFNNISVILWWSVLLESKKRYQRGNQNPYVEEEQTTQCPKEKVQKDKRFVLLKFSQACVDLFCLGSPKDVSICSVKVLPRMYRFTNNNSTTINRTNQHILGRTLTEQIDTSSGEL